MVNCLGLVVKGFIIGIGKVIPGVSGSLIAVSLGLYEKLINTICCFFKNVKKNTIFLGSICIGIILAIVIGSKVISILLIHYYLPTMFIFIGLIAGTIPSIIDNAHIKSIKDMVIIIISFLVVIVISEFVSNNTFVGDGSVLSNFIVLLMGFIEATTMIIPGISGTAIFILLGYYQFLLEMFSNLTNFNYLLSNMSYILMFVIGLGIGIIVITKLMNYLFKNFKTKVYSAIIGFALSSILMLLNNILNTNLTFRQIIVSLILCIAGYKVASKLDY